MRVFHRCLAIFCSAFLLATPAAFAGTSYFVDSATGSNAYDGMSEATPWRNFENISGSLLQPGDQVLLKRGGLWEGEYMALSSSGTALEPIVIGAYGAGTQQPVLRGAATFAQESLSNGDLDRLASGQGTNAETPVGWAVNPGDAANHIVMVGEPLAYKGRSVEMGYVQGVAARMWRGINKIAYGLPYRFTVRVKVESGALLVRVRSPSTCKYFDGATQTWQSVVTTAPVAAQINPTAGWQTVTVAFTNDVAANSGCTVSPPVVSSLELNFYMTKGTAAQGVAYIDDVALGADWAAHAANVYKRGAITGAGDMVGSVYVGDALQQQRIRLSDLAQDGDWYWEGGQTYCEATDPASQRYPFYRLSNAADTCRSGYVKQGPLPDSDTLYVYWSDTNPTPLAAADLMAARGNSVLIDVNGEYCRIEGLALEKAGTGVQLRNHNPTVRNNTLRYLDAYTVRVYGGNGDLDVRDIVIEGNLFHDSGNGPYLFRAANALVRANTLYHIDRRGAALADNETLPMQAGFNVVWEYNVVHDSWIGVDIWGRKNSPGQTYNSEAFNNVVRYNTIYNIATVGVMIGGETRLIDPTTGEECPDSTPGCVNRAHVYNNFVHDNIIYNCGYGSVNGAGIRHNKTAYPSPNFIYDNTLYANRVSFNGETVAGNFVLKNNISLNPALAHLDFPGNIFLNGDLASSALANNLYYPGATAVTDPATGLPQALFKWNGGEYTMFADYVAASARDTVGSAAADPLLVDATAGDFRLGAGSPAIDSGTFDIGVDMYGAPVDVAETDAAGNPVAVGSSPDKGALEAPDTDRDKIADVNDAQPANVFAPNSQGWNLSRRADLATDDARYLASDTLHLRIWAANINAAKFNPRKSWFRMFSGGTLVQQGSLLSAPEGFTGAFALGGRAPGNYTLDFNVEDNRDRYTSTGIPFSIR